MDSSPPPDLLSLGQFVRGRRRELGLTQTELAERTSWVQERISVLERGKYGVPSLPVLGRLARALEVPLPRLLAAAGFDVEAFSDGDEDVAHAQALLYVLERLLKIDARTLEDALTQSVDLLVQALGADKVDAYLYDPSLDALVAVGTSHTPLAVKERALGLHALPLSEGGRIVEVFETCRSFRHGHLDQDPLALDSVKHALGVRSVICVPLYIDGECRGTLLASSLRPDQFSEEDEEYLDTVARWVGMVAHHADLERRLNGVGAEIVPQRVKQ